MLDHMFLTVADTERSIAFYEDALAPLGITHVLDYDGKNGLEGPPDLQGFGSHNRVYFWLRPGQADQRSALGFVASSEAEVETFYQAAMAAGARLHNDPRYYAASVFDHDGYSLGAVYKSRQHPA
ncbi:VOC family protein [bacterium]|nr:VOC family protein [bacterium]